VKRWTIYCHTHIESGRQYIGLTSRTMERRWSQHVIQAKHLKGNRSYFANAIRKYGKDAFEHRVLAMSWDLEGANATEIAIIEQENTRNPTKGFNVAQGGGSKPNPNPNLWDDHEYRAKHIPRMISQLHASKVRDAVKATLRTPEARAKQSSILKASFSRPEFRVNSLAHWKTQLGKKHSPEHKEKIRVATKLALSCSEIRAKMSASSKIALSRPEVRAKMSAFMKMRSPEVIAKIAASNRGKKRSPEQIEKSRIIMNNRLHSSYYLAQQAARIAAKTHFNCKTHGQILLIECYQRQCCGQIRYECRECLRVYKSIWKKKHRFKMHESQIINSVLEI